jgi:Zn-dependent protease with chaperone function
MNLALLTQALGWALLHSLWQLIFVGAAAALLLHLAGEARPRTQHLIAWVALAACLALPLGTFLWGLHPILAAPALPGATGTVLGYAAPASAPLEVALPWSLRLQVFLGQHLPGIALAWGVGVTLLGLRLAGGWLATQRWRRAAEPIPEGLEMRFRALAIHMKVSARVVLRVTSRSVGPITLGLWRPIVLVPTSLLTSLPEPYLEALLAHELAHVRRHDYLFNLLQSLIAVLLFHHPVVWWLSRRIRTLREHLCDDLAAAAIGEPRRLALALDALDDLSSPAHPRLALAAHGGTLFTRIHRLLLPPATQARPAWLPALLLALALPCATVALHAASIGPPISADPALIQQLDALAVKEGLDPHLLRALAWAESGLVRKATSPRGALGLLQVMPETARRYGVTDLQDADQVLAAGAKHLHALLDRYQGDMAKAITAYNLGAEALDAGRSSPEASAHRDLVLDLYAARAVQPAAPLGDGCVEGVLRRMTDGNWVLSVRLSSRVECTLEILSDAPGDPPKNIGTMRSYSSSRLDPGVWSVSQPRITFPPPAQSPVIIRASDPGIGYVGETHLRLEGPYQTFAFRMEPIKK